MSFHLFPTLLLVIDLVLFSPPYSVAALPSFGLSGVIALVYYFWVEHCYSKNGFYPYPIFDEAGFNGRIILFAGSATVMGVATGVLKAVYAAVNGRDMDLKMKPKPHDERKRR